VEIINLLNFSTGYHPTKLLVCCEVGHATTNFLLGFQRFLPSKHDDVGPTSERDLDVGPTPRRIGPTSARCRADEQTTSIRRRADVNYRYVADVVLTSARRRRVYWVSGLSIGLLCRVPPLQWLRSISDRSRSNINKSTEV